MSETIDVSHLVEEHIPPSTLEQITEAVLKKESLETELEELEEKQSQLQRQVAEITGGFGQDETGQSRAIEGLIPKLLDACSVQEITLKNGMKVKIKDELKPPSVAKDSVYLQPVLDWCDKTGNEGIIKDLIVIPFDKGDKVVLKVIRFLTWIKKVRPNFMWDRYRSVNPQTLAKLFRDIKEKPRPGEKLPIVELGIKEYRYAKIEHVKEAKIKGL